MTKKHFEAIAKNLNDTWKAMPDRLSRIDLEMLMSNIAYTFSQVNTRFDTKRFLEACKKED